MKKIISALLILLGVLALAGCVGMNTADGKNPWAPPEKKKPLAERWEEEATRRAEQPATAAPAGTLAAAPAVQPAPEIAAPESREIAEIIEIVADGNARFAVAWRLGGVRIPVKKGEIFAVRGKDLSLRGAARLDVIDGDTLGFALLGGNAAAGDFITAPNPTLSAELDEAFLQK